MQLGLGLGLTHVQQAGGGGEETPAWLDDFLGPNDEVPFAVADFQNGNYWLDGAEVTDADIIDHPELIGVNGLASDGATIIKFVAAAKTYLLTNSWSLILDFNNVGDGGRVLAATGNLVSLDMNSGGIAKVTDLADAEAEERYVESVANVTPQSAGRVAVTRTDAKLAVSFNGAVAVVNDSLSFSIAGIADYFLLSSFEGAAATGIELHALAIFEPLPDADLPILLAPSPPAWLEDFRAPSGNLPEWVVDPKNGRYWAAPLGGSGAAATDGALLSEVTRIVDGTGLVLENESNSVMLIGPGLIPLTDDKSFTIVIRFDDSGDGASKNPICITGQAGAELIESVREGAAPTARYNFSDFDGGNGNLVQSAQNLSDGLKTIAVSRSNDLGIAASVGGAAIVVDNSPGVDPDLTGMAANLGGYAAGSTVGGAITIEWVACYPRQPNADLPTLSALS